MDAGLLAAIGSVGGAIIGAQATIIVALIRRGNGGQQHNPNLETLQMLLEQAQRILESIEGKLDNVLQDLAGIKAKG